MQIRQATPTDGHAILEIILPVIREGATYALDRHMSEADALDYWLGSDMETFVADEGGAILGTHYIRANQAGGGSMSVTAVTRRICPPLDEVLRGRCANTL